MKKPDIFDPSKRYVFNNWSTEDFERSYANPDFQFIPPPEDEYTQKEIKRMYELEFKRNGFKTFKVPAGGMVEVPEWLAFLMCKHFVDREFVKSTESKYGPLSIAKNNGNKNEKAESEILNMNSPDAREALEEKTIRLIKESEESPIIAMLREQIREEERAKLMKHAAHEYELSHKENALNKDVKVVETTTTSESSVEVQAPKTTRRGRPPATKEFAEIANETPVN